MKSKYIVAAIVSALALGGAAAPAFADDFRGPGYGPGYGNAYHQDWRQDGRGQITVRTQRGQFTVDRGDRMFYRLTDRPYRFRPGFTYLYTDRCNRDGCMVLEFARWSRMPTDRFFAPYVRFERIAWDRDDRWGQDFRDFRGSQNWQSNGQPNNFRDFDRRSDSRDFRGDASPTPPPPQPAPQPGYGQNDNSGRGAQFRGNGQYHDRDLLGGPH